MRRRKKGFSVFEFIIFVSIFFMLISIFINTLPVWINKEKVENITRNIIREIQLTGNTNVNSLVSSLETRYKINNLVVNVTPKRKLSLGEKFEVEVFYNTQLKFFELGTFPIQIRAKDQGISEVYIK